MQNLKFVALPVPDVNSKLYSSSSTDTILLSS